MKIKFANGDVKECTLPLEHKVFKSIGTEIIAIGWGLTFKIIGPISSSDEVDALLTPENIESLVFLSKTDEGELKTHTKLDGYKKVTASTIHYSEDIEKTTVEIQLTKGV